MNGMQFKKESRRNPNKQKKSYAESKESFHGHKKRKEITKLISVIAFLGQTKEAGKSSVQISSNVQVLQKAGKGIENITILGDMAVLGFTWN